MDYNERVSEVMCPLAVEYPDSLAPGTHQSAWINVSGYHRLWFLVMLGDMGAGSEVWFDLHMARDAAGTDETDINDIDVGDTTTSDYYFQANGDGNQLICIEMGSETLEWGRDYPYVSCVAEIFTSNIEAGWVLFGVSPRFPPVPQTAWTEVVD